MEDSVTKIKEKKKNTDWEKYLQNRYLMNGLYVEYIDVRIWMSSRLIVIIYIFTYIESLCCACETNIKLFVNCISIKKRI